MAQPEIETQLPTPQFCALRAYGHLKDGRQASDALAWATLGTLLINLPTEDGSDDRAEVALRVAKAAQAVAVADTQKNRWDLQQALLEWIESE